MSNPDTATAFAVQRTNMVDSQIRPSDVTDRRIIRAMLQVPREQFVPASLAPTAYMDNAISLGSAGRRLLEPRLFAKMLQVADIPDGGRVLEVGCGTGYGLAVLSAMGLRATGVDDDPGLTAAAASAIARLEITATTAVRTGPLNEGSPADGPFDAIIVSGAVETPPQRLFDQLKAGGRLVAVAGKGPGGKATVWTRSGTQVAAREAFDAAATVLPGFAAPPVFAL